MRQEDIEPGKFYLYREAQKYDVGEYFGIVKVIRYNGDIVGIEKLAIKNTSNWCTEKYHLKLKHFITEVKDTKDFKIEDYPEFFL